MYKQCTFATHVFAVLGNKDTTQIVIDYLEIFSRDVLNAMESIGISTIDPNDLTKYSNKTLEIFMGALTPDKIRFVFQHICCIQYEYTFA